MSSRTLTPMQRQRLREQQSIDSEIAFLRQRPRAHTKPPTYENPNKPAGPIAQTHMGRFMPPATPAQLATADRYIETIIAAEHPITGEVVAKGEKVVTLLDRLHSEKTPAGGRLISMELWEAGDLYRRLFMEYAGGSKGVSSYGDYVPAAPASQRTGIAQRQIKAGEDLRAATVAAFGTFTKERKWVVDEELMSLVIPALIYEKKSAVSQSEIGAKRSAYTGAGQQRAIGAHTIAEVLQRLTLHFGYRSR